MAGSSPAMRKKFSLRIRFSNSVGHSRGGIFRPSFATLFVRKSDKSDLRGRWSAGRRNIFLL
jgi:hypothetical protein